MFGSVWKHWNWLDDGLIPFISAIVHTSWAIPITHLLLNNPFVKPQGIIYPFWLMLVLILAPSILERTLASTPKARWVTAIAGLIATLGSVLVLFHVSPNNFTDWSRTLLVAMRHLKETIPSALIVFFLSVFFWYRGMKANWSSRDQLWHNFIRGTVLLSFSALLGEPLIPRKLLATSILLFTLSGMFSLALLAVKESLLIEKARGTETPSLNRYWFVAMGSIIVLILVGGWLGSHILSPRALAEVKSLLSPLFQLLGYVFRLALTAVAYLLFLILSPLINALHNQPAPLPTPPPHPRSLAEQWQKNHQATPTQIAPWLQSTFTILFILLLFGITVLLFLSAWRRRAQQRGYPGVVEKREYIWSWELLRSQLQNLLRRSPKEEQEVFLPLDQLQDPRQAIRKLYQLFLSTTKELGYPRPPGLTPLAYSMTLQQVFPSIKEPLAALTKIYIEARYSPSVPSSEQVQIATRAWERLQSLLSQISPSEG